MDITEAGTAFVTKIVDVARSGAGPIAGARRVAEEHRRHHPDTERAIARLCATHERIVGVAGFTTGLGGLITLPVTIPTDVGVLYIYEARLAAAIAHLRGYDIDSDEVQSVILLSLLGAGGTEIAKQFGVDLANKAAMQAAKKIPGRVCIEINKKVGFRLVTKTGATGLINIAKLVPVAGGVAGAGMNVASMRTVATYAKKNFPPLEPQGDAAGPA